MLVLRRSEGKSSKIILRVPGLEEEIVISILKGSAKVGVDAPPEVDIVRAELVEEGTDSDE